MAPWITLASTFTAIIISVISLVHTIGKDNNYNVKDKLDRAKADAVNMTKIEVKLDNLTDQITGIRSDLQRTQMSVDNLGLRFARMEERITQLEKRVDEIEDDKK